MPDMFIETDNVFPEYSNYNHCSINLFSEAIEDYHLYGARQSKQTDLCL